MSKEAAKDLLAKLLATEDITIQRHPGVSTAMFDLVNRILTVPVWKGISNDLEDLLLVHEVGHALDTPVDEYPVAVKRIAKKIYGDTPDASQENSVRGFLNIIEDCRIDKRQKRRYPGSRRNYIYGYKELHTRDFFDLGSTDINKLILIDRLNIYFKGGSTDLKMNFTQEEKVIIGRIEKLETFEETVLLTEEIYKHSLDEIENQRQQEDELASASPQKGDSDDSMDGYIAIDFDESEADDSSEGDDGEGKGKGGEEDGNQEGIKAKATNGQLGSSNAKILPIAITDRAWEKNLSRIAGGSNVKYVYVNMPDVDWKDAVHDYTRVYKEVKHLEQNTRFSQFMNQSRTEFTRWRNSEKHAVSYMVSEFERRKSAELYARIRTAKTGVIDTNKLHSYTYNDDLFKRITTIPKGKNHGFVMLLDWSGSMGTNLKSTVKQLLSLVMFCKSIQVPFEVFLFKDTQVAMNSPWSIPADKKNVLRFDSVVLRNVLSSRMKVDEFNRAAAYMWTLGNSYHSGVDSLGGTPLISAVNLLPHIVKNFRDRNKLEITNTIIITDGDSSPLRGVVNSSVDMRFQYNDTIKYFYNHPETKKTYEFEIGYGFTDKAMDTFLDILRDTTGSNLIGFFLAGNNPLYVSRRYGYDRSVVEKFWNEHHFFPVKTRSYNEYYIIDTPNSSSSPNSFKITSNQNTDQMARTFSTFTKQKAVNRQLLRRFIDNIADYNKAAG